MKKRTITIEEAAGGHPIWTITDDVISQFAEADQLVWFSLYEWLVQAHGAEKQGLHNRTHVGDILMKRLLAAASSNFRRCHEHCAIPEWDRFGRPARSGNP
jgi:hypothetical protein